MQRVKALLIWLWRIASRPSAHLSLAFLALGGFVCGVMGRLQHRAGSHQQFCTSCHEMHDNVFQELQHTPHFSNRSGVRATARLDQ
jgi:cytochrome c-type protein NapC